MTHSKLNCRSHRGKVSIALFLGGILACILCLTSWLGAAATLSTPASETNSPVSVAFGRPGACPTWTDAALTLLGTAQNRRSHLWFTGSQGIITQVFYPSVDTAATVDWQFLVGDAAQTWVDEEKRDTLSQVQLQHPRSLAWRVENTAKNGRYKIEKTVFTDPNADALILQVTLTALEGKLGDFRLYTLYHPAIDNQGWATTGYRASPAGIPILVAKNPDSGNASALVSSLPFQPNKLSSGYVGQSDGWQDLLGGSADHQMNWTFDRATQGNIAQMAEFDLSSYAEQQSVQFHLVLGFGHTDRQAITTATRTLQADLAQVFQTYNAQWQHYTDRLDDQGGTADDLYYLAAMVLKASQDKESGAMVAGLGHPWGDEAPGADCLFSIRALWRQGGYHVVWARDLYKFASALIAAGDRETANAALDWLFNVMQQPDGHFPQNAWVDGTPHWRSIQLDETALPLVLAWKLGQTDAETYQQHIQPAADYLVKHGPWTVQERWEENSGYSPSTIAAEIAGLVTAADIARLNGDDESQQRYLETADSWQHQVETWTFTTTGSIQEGRYFIRIDDNGDPNDGHSLTIRNGGGVWDERSIVDMSFLELVRHGVKAADDPHILASLAPIDATIRQIIPDKGEAWFRYNHDGYGETATGENYTGAGVGRLWPLLTGERGHYAIARGESAAPYLATLKAFANASGFIPEQVWDLNPPAGEQPGTPTRAMTPLNWAMGEYITLLASQHQGRIVDQPEIVYQRYAQQ